MLLCCKKITSEKGCTYPHRRKSLFILWDSPDKAFISQSKRDVSSWSKTNDTTQSQIRHTKLIINCLYVILSTVSTHQRNFCQVKASPSSLALEQARWG